MDGRTEHAGNPSATTPAPLEPARPAHAKPTAQELAALTTRSAHRKRPGTDVDSLLTAAAAGNAVQLVDVEERHIRRPGDLLNAIFSLLGIALVLLVSYFGPETTAAVTEDVQDVVDRTARQILLLPFTFIEGVVLFLIPVSVLVVLTVKRQWRIMAQALVAAAITYVLAYLGALGLEQLGDTNPLNLALAQNFRGVHIPALAPFVASMSGLLTAVGHRSSSQFIRIAWVALLIAVFLGVLQGDQSLSGAIVSLLLGRTVGFATNYVSAVRSTRASGLSLVRGLRRAGIDPELVIRLDAEGTPVRSFLVSTDFPVGHNAQFRLEPSESEQANGGEAATPSSLDDLMRILEADDDVIAFSPLPISDEVQAILAEDRHRDRFGQNRRYAVFENGTRLNVGVLDGDRQVVGFLANVWDSLRIRGLEQTVRTNLRAAAEHTVLMSLAARDAGVNVPAVLGVARAEDSILLVRPSIPGGRTFGELETAEITDELLDLMWAELRLAHDAGLAHRSLSQSRIVVDESNDVWIVGWDAGEIASTELSRRIDMAQLVAMAATRVGVERALARARSALSHIQLSSLAPLLQRIVLPQETRDVIGNNRWLIPALRTELVRLEPAVADVPDVSLERFSFRRLVTVAVAFAAILVVFGTFNWNDVADSFDGTNPWWLLGAFGAGLATYLGAAIGLVSFTPEKLGLRRTTAVQIASSIVSLVAPAGIGPAAIDLRYLVKQGIEGTLAVATVTLVQVTRFIVTVTFLILVLVVSGAGAAGGPIAIPSGAVMISILLIVLAAGVVVAIPPIRNYVARKLGPVMRQIWPRVVWVIGNPARLAKGIFGNAIQVAGYVAAFGMTLAAFGYTLPLATLALTYLASAGAGSLVPSPAGIGPVELALSSGLTIAGIPSAVAVSVTVVFRVLTLWARLPIGWIALRYLQKRDVL
ncbi:MAG TPA: lysylphosphatidylglycerol synthase transmembrane domain-containing protein [Actinomycetaceae bacterium]|nr:lysylphosphatidylglycerol synthase transmembrane domain-containing protein [Actinomycetaceae bacterium]